jgi:Domain of unknown function (DUF1906)
MTVLLSSIQYMWQDVILPRVGDVYVFGGTLIATQPGSGTDCSGAVSAANEAILYGANMSWARQFSTLTFAGANPGSTGPYGGIPATAGWVCVASPSDIPAGAVMQVAVLQLSNPSDAHMVCAVLDPTNATGLNPNLDPNMYIGIESGGSFTNAQGQSTLHIGSEATAITDPEFDQWFYLPGPVQGGGSTSNRGLDYSGGTLSPADILDNDYAFVCRYLFNGAPGLPFKLLTPSEASGLMAADVEVVGVYEGAANGMQSGAPQGTHDVNDALTNGDICGMPAGAVIYFAADWDVAESDGPAITAYLQAVNAVIGVASTGIYGSALACQIAFNAGVAQWFWQTEAWSNGIVVPYANIVQNSETIGEVTVDNVQCDVDTSMTSDFGQWNPTGVDEMTPEQAAQLAALFSAFCTPVTSQSPFRALGEGALWQQWQLPVNDDGFDHPKYVEWAAERGSAFNLAVLTTLAAGNVSQFPDRADDIALAQVVLARVQAVLSGQTPVTPVVPVTPVSPVVTPVVDPVTPPVVVTPTSSRLSDDIKAAVSVLGGAAAVGTWVLHSFEGVLSPGETTLLSGAIVVVTGLISKLVTVEHSLATETAAAKTKISFKWSKKDPETLGPHGPHGGGHGGRHRRGIWPWPWPPIGEDEDD